jgi:hypothetical protein
MNTNNDTALARNVTRLTHLDLPGGGQVCVAGKYAYVGHVGARDGHGTTILDIADPKNPKVVCALKHEHPDSHSHKVRVVGDIMIVNVEQNSTGMGRRAEDMHHVRAQLQRSLGRAPSDEELEQALHLKKGDLPLLLKTNKSGYANGGFKIYDISNRAAPRLLAYQKTGGVGVHRFDMDENYAYISTEMEGYLGNILVIYDIRDPSCPVEVSRWWLPGQHIAGGETPTWVERSHRLHHALRRGDRMWAGVWQGGMRVVDVSDITRPRTIGSYNYHPPFKDPTHTFMPLTAPINGRQIAVTIDEEERYYNPEVSAERRGRTHACISVFDVTNVDDIKPLSLFQVSELDSPWSRMPGGRFGAHQFHEHPDSTIIYATWFGGGLRIIDLADPFAPQEVGHFIPDPVCGNKMPQSNDVYVDQRGLIYMTDRNAGFDILEFQG